MSLPLAPFLAELTRRIDLAQLYPPFRDRYLETLVACHDRGSDYYGISGHRPIAEQDDLYAIGRAKLADGTWTVVDAGKIVTKAQGGSSAHNYGVATDSSKDANVDRAGLQPSWSIADYSVLAEEGERVGLEAAYRWVTFREGPHLQLPFLDRGITLAEMRSLYAKGGIPAVWDRLDSVGGKW